MTKYQEYFQRMLKGNQELFDKFAKVHTDYSLDKEHYQEEFNKVGTEVLRVIRTWENKLCSQSEKAGFGGYTGNLAEKFQTEIKNHFPLIDHVGIIVKKFTLKKISL